MPPPPPAAAACRSTNHCPPTATATTTATRQPSEPPLAHLPHSALWAGRYKNEAVKTYRQSVQLKVHCVMFVNTNCLLLSFSLSVFVRWFSSFSLILLQKKPKSLNDLFEYSIIWFSYLSEQLLSR